MQAELKEAAEQERYEEAAQLRDEVAALRKEIAGNALAIVGEKKVSVKVVSCVVGEGA